jgi:hypothetical protein
VGGAALTFVELFALAVALMDLEHVLQDGTHAARRSLSRTLSVLANSRDWCVS